MICKDCYANYGGAPGTVLCLLHEATQELLEAAKAIDELDDGDEPFAWRHAEAFRRLNAAIAKATGNQG